MNLLRAFSIATLSLLFLMTVQTGLAAVFVVTNVNDSGPGSLRQAVLDANVNGQDDSIGFDPAVFDAPRVITLTSGEINILPDNAGISIGHLVAINGTGANRLEINGNNNSRIFHVRPYGKLALDGVKLSGGNGMSNGLDPNLNGEGGAIKDESGISPTDYNVTLTNCIVSGNVAVQNDGAGGGLLLQGRALIINTAIVDNAATFYGGGILMTYELRMYNSTISRNSARLNGGLYCNGADLYLVNSEIVLNHVSRADAVSAGLVVREDQFSFSNFYPKNSIIANNTAAVMPPEDVTGGVRSRGNNIFGRSAGMFFRESSPTDLVNVDPQIDVGLSNNGGIIPSHALRAGSPAIDSGDNCVLMTFASGGCSDVAITQDHRGVVRPQDADLNGTATVDRGTFEATAAEIAGAPGRPDLQAIDDSGVSNSDNITATSAVTFDVGNFTAGATVELLRNGVTVASGVATGTSFTFEDNLSVAGTYVYTARQISGGVTSLQGNSLTVVFDNVAPTGLVSQSAGQADPTRLQPINFTLTFNEPVVGFSSTDLTFTGSTAGTASAIVNVAGSSPTYSLGISNITSDGAVVLGVLAGAVQDTAGNTNEAFGGGDNSVTLDTTPPTVTINQAAAQLDPTRLLPINFTVVFSEPVSGFTNADVSLAGSTANVLSAVKIVTGAGPTYNVAISNVTSNGGTVVASILAASVQDAAGNVSLVSTSTDNSVTLDNTSPAVTINQAAGQADPTNVLPINYTVVFTEPVTGFDALDILFSGSSINTTQASVIVTGSGTTYNVAIGNISSSGGILRASVRSTAAVDAVGNSSIASSSTDNSVTFDNAAPIVTVNQAIGQSDPTQTQPINFTAVFNEIVTGLQPIDISLAGSTANVSAASVSITGSGSVFTISVSGVTSSGQVRVSIPAGAAQDAVGNNSLASTSTDNSVTISLRSSPFDFDGDGKADIGIFRPAGAASEWWINRSGNGQTFALQFGAWTDKITPADYTGDGKTDIAFFRPASGEWYVLRSEDFSFFALPFGTNGDVPVPADYDADGKADFAVFRPSSSTWFLSQSSGAPTRIEQFGLSGDQPVVADYDGDGKSDIGIFRAAAGGAEWWIQRSTAGSIALQFGANTDKPVQADYTGDGKADIAIWRPSSGEWFILRSEDLSFYGFPFGANDDVPAPGDYDGDGKADPTVFRPSSATWFIARTTAGTQIVQFGATGDRPLPNAFIP